MAKAPKNSNAAHTQPKMPHQRTIQKKASNIQRTKQLKEASLRTRKESMRINRQFSQIEHDPTL